MLLCRDHPCPSLAPQGCHSESPSCVGNLYSLLHGDNSRQSGHRRRTFHLAVYCMCCSSACCHTPYDVNIRPFMYYSSRPPPSAPHPVMLLLAALQHPPASPPLSSSSSPFYFLPLPFTSYFIIGQQNVCHIPSRAEALLLPLPFPLICLLSN